MESGTENACYDIGIIGLGTMGSALARNLLNKGFAVAAYSREESERMRFHALALGSSSGSRCGVFEDLGAFVRSLSAPRKALLMITAGAAVDEVLDAMTPLLTPGDTVIDGGNSWYRDTARRQALLRGRGLHYMGVGVSGGERGALEGPSIMAGGDPEGWAQCAGILSACAAKYDGLPCCRYMGADGAGHYVKMLHNGVEYGILQLIAEAYSLMGSLPGWAGGEPVACFERWRSGKLASYLIDAAAIVLARKDSDGAPLVDKIADVAGQNGTGKWTALEGIERGVYIPTISEALAMRSHSARLTLRQKGQQELALAPIDMATASEASTSAHLWHIAPCDLEDALYAAMLCCYSQGLELLYAASAQLGWAVSLRDAVEVWKAGCIIRADMLGSIGEALDGAYEGNLLFAKEFHPLQEEQVLRKIVSYTAAAGLSAPAFSASLNYYDACRAGRTPINLIQGMRDHFGAHGFRRTDKEGVFHID